MEQSNLIVKVEQHGNVLIKKEPSLELFEHEGSSFQDDQECNMFQEVDYKPQIVPKTEVDTPGATLKCPKCDEFFSNLNDLDKHVSTHVMELLKHQFEDSSPDNQNSHLENYLDSDVVRCDICKKVYSCKYSLDRHKVMYHQLKCELCKEVLQTEKLLVKHMSEKHSQTIEYFPRRKIRKEARINVECHLCGKMFHRNPNIIWHFKKKHPGFEPRFEYKCIRCPVIFKTKESFETHTGLHSQIEDVIKDPVNTSLANGESEKVVRKRLKGGNHTIVKCYICAKDFSRSANLKRHFENFHPGIEAVINYVCPKCKLVFATKPEMEKHKKGHDEQRNHYDYMECHLCQKLFVKVRNYRRHYKAVHPGIKPVVEFKCPKCTRVFTRKANFEKHLQNRHQTRRGRRAKPVVELKNQSKDDEEDSEMEEEYEYRESEDGDENESYDSIEIGKYECEECPLVFDSFSELECHGKVHIALIGESSSTTKLQKPYNFDTIDSEMVAIPLIEPNFNTYGCFICEDVFETRAELTEHSNIHIKQECDSDSA